MKSCKFPGSSGGSLVSAGNPAADMPLGSSKAGTDNAVITLRLQQEKRHYRGVLTLEVLKHITATSVISDFLSKAEHPRKMNHNHCKLLSLQEE